MYLSNHLPKGVTQITLLPLLYLERKQLAQAYPWSFKGEGEFEPSLQS